MGQGKSSPKREAHTDTGLPQETKISNKESKYTFKGTTKRRISKDQS